MELTLNQKFVSSGENGRRYTLTCIDNGPAKCVHLKREKDGVTLKMRHDVFQAFLRNKLMKKADAV